MRGAIWTLIDTAGGQGLSFLTFLILARILLPETYGVISLSAALLALPGILLNEGMSDALVQREDINDRHLNSVFWANLALSLIFIMLVQALAGVAARLSGVPLVEPVLRWTSLMLVAPAVTSVIGGIFRRRMQYSTFALRTFVATTSGALVGVIMALAGYGIWSLVGMQLTTGAVSILVMLLGVGWWPKLEFSVAAMSDIYAFSARLMVGSILRMAIDKVDIIIIGMFLDVTSLGYYYLAIRMLTTIEMITITPVSWVMMPVLARMKNDQIRLTDAYISMVWALASLWVPAVAGLGILSPTLLPLLFGQHWGGAVPIMMITSIAGVAVPLLRPTPHILVAIGKPGAYARLNFIQLSLMVVCFSFAVHFGIIGASWAFVGVMLAMVPFHLAALKRAAAMPVGALLTRYVRVLAAAAVMIAALSILREWWRVSDWKTLLAQIIIGTLVYAAALYSLATGEVHQLLSVLYSALPRSLRADTRTPNS